MRGLNFAGIYFREKSPKCAKLNRTGFILHNLNPKCLKMNVLENAACLNLFGFRVNQLLMTISFLSTVVNHEDEVEDVTTRLCGV